MSKLRPFATISAGVIVGAALGYALWSRGIGMEGVVTLSHERAIVVSVSEAPNLLQRVTAAQDRAAQLDDVGRLSSELERIAGEVGSGERDLELDALLAKLSSLDARAAFMLVQQLELGPKFIAASFQSWFEASPEAALSELRLSRGYASKAAALGLVEYLGNTHEAVERVAAALPYEQAQILRIAAVERQAEGDPSLAIEQALRLDPAGTQQIALVRIAQLVTPFDARAALDLAAVIPYWPQRARYIEEVFDTWASFDPESVLSHLENAKAPGLIISSATLRQLSALDPERLLAIGHKLSPDAQLDSDQAAIESLLAKQPAIAYAYVNDMTPGKRRNLLLAQILDEHAKVSPSEALSYVLELKNPPLGAIERALTKVAVEDLHQAVGVAIDTLKSDTTGTRGRLGMVVSAAFDGGASADVTAVVDLIANHPDQRVRLQLDGSEEVPGVLQQWARADPEGALNWSLRNPSKVSPKTIEYLGSFADQLSPEALNSTIYALPADRRGHWVVGVANGLADSDLEAAIEWLAPMRGAPVYTTALDSVLVAAATRAPADVARAIEDRLDSPRPALVSTVAREWAAREPNAAAEWIANAENIDEPGRAVALYETLRAWSRRNQADAENWTKNLPSGSRKDSALGALIREGATTGSINVALLEEYNSSDARARDLVESMTGFRASDPDLGRWLIDQYISDTALRDRARQRLEGSEPRAPIRVVDGEVVRQ